MMIRILSTCVSMFALATAASADTRVVATWYGNELAGHRTASGAPFNPNGLTAAHKSLPFGTCLAPAAMVVFLWGDHLIQAYVSLVHR